jgi:ABC-type transport system involved in cytochrome c biogenesis ATPase subunit
MLLGLAAPTSGRALVLGRPYGDLDHPALSVGAVLEATGFHPGRSGRDHLRTLGHAVGLTDSRTDEVLRIVEPEKAGRRRAKGYSLGMRQRLGLAGALLGDPELLLLDEPANGLDAEGVRWLRDFLRAFASEGGTALVSSHVLAEVAQTVDQGRHRPQPSGRRDRAARLGLRGHRLAIRTGPIGRSVHAHRGRERVDGAQDRASAPARRRWRCPTRLDGRAGAGRARGDTATRRDVDERPATHLIPTTPATEPGRITAPDVPSTASTTEQAFR